MWKLPATVIDYCEFVLLVTPSAILQEQSVLLLITGSLLILKIFSSTSSVGILIHSMQEDRTLEIIAPFFGIHTWLTDSEAMQHPRTVLILFFTCLFSFTGYSGRCIYTEYTQYISFTICILNVPDTFTYLVIIVISVNVYMSTGVIMPLVLPECPVYNDDTLPPLLILYIAVCLQS